MPERRNFILKNSVDHDKVNEVNQTILRLQRRAEIKRAIQRGKELIPTGKSLTEEFFEGLNIA